MFLLDYIFWQECDIPKWLHIGNWDIYDIHYVKGHHYKYKLEGSFSGQGGMSSHCYRKKRFRFLPRILIKIG